jgi:glycosyltransferase involved in cell wall biosynthesis
VPPEVSPRAPRLLFIVSSLGIGGAEKQLVTLLNHLDPTRFDLHLAYLKRDERLLPQLNRDSLRQLVCCDVQRRLEWHAVRQLRQLVSARQIDAIVCTNPYAMLYGALARGTRSPRPRLATVLHTTVPRSYKEGLQMWLYRPVFRRCDLLVYVCESQRRYWREQGLRPVEDCVVYNGIDVDYYSYPCSGAQKLQTRRDLGLSSSDYVIGLCSMLRPEKQHGLLVRAIARLRARGVPARALLIGDGPERAAIEQLAAALRIAEHVRITGARADVRPLIACCDVMTLVSSTETFSLSTLESMAQGKPLVMSDVGGAAEQVQYGENGFLFGSGDLDVLVLHLTSLASAPLRTHMGAAAALRVRRQFTLEAMCASFGAQMARLVGSDSCDRSGYRTERSSRLGSRPRISQ